MGLADQQGVLLEEMPRRLADELSEVPSVAAVWLGGSGGRGEADALSDIDLVVVAEPNRIEDLRAAVRRHLATAGRVASIHQAPQNAPVTGAQLNVLYDTDPLPIYIDWNVWPHVGERPSDVRVLFEREPMAPSERAFHEMLDEAPRGSNTPLSERMSEFRIFMAPILMKYAARGSLESVEQIHGLLQLEGGPPKDYDQARRCALSVLEDAPYQNKTATDTIRRYIEALDKMRVELAS